VITKYPYGWQPGREVLRQQGRTVAGTARRIGVNRQHLVQALEGRIRPSMQVRNELPAFLGVPLSELFNEDALASPGVRTVDRRVA
jgi:transcriptional regulator with XRE-family HTH domain